MEDIIKIFSGILSALICVIKFYFDLKRNSTKIILKEKYYKKILMPFYSKPESVKLKRQRYSQSLYLSSFPAIFTCFAFSPVR